MSKKVKLIIEISEEIYREAVNSGYSHLYDEEVATAVSEGTLLSDVKTSSNKITEMDVKEYCDKHNLTVIDNNYKEAFVKTWCRHNGFLPPRKRKQKSKLNITWFENTGDNK